SLPTIPHPGSLRTGGRTCHRLPLCSSRPLRASPLDAAARCRLRQTFVVTAVVISREIDRMLLEAISQRPKRDPQKLRRALANAPRALERLQDEPPFELAEHQIELAPLRGKLRKRGGRAARKAAHLGRQIAETDRSRRRERHRPLHHVLELAH